MPAPESVLSGRGAPTLLCKVGSPTGRLASHALAESAASTLQTVVSGNWSQANMPGERNARRQYSRGMSISYLPGAQARDMS